jgi:nucleotide-binding universal stress UspA family protein
MLREGRPFLESILAGTGFSVCGPRAVDGRSALEKLFLGSTARRLLRMVPAPVPRIGEKR